MEPYQGVDFDCMEPAPAFGGLVLLLAEAYWAEKIDLAGVVGKTRVGERQVDPEEAALQMVAAEKGSKSLV